MAGIETYKNHELMNVASELMREEFAVYQIEGGEYDGVVTKLMAEKVLSACMPHILDFLNTRVVIEAPTAHVVIPPEPTPRGTPLALPTAPEIRPVEGVHVEAKFKNIEFQPVVYREHLEGFTGSLLVEDYDLFAVVQPQYFDPDPSEIVFGDSVMVPFGNVSHFEPSERKAA